MTQTHLQAASWAIEVANAITAQGDARAFDVPLLLRDAAHRVLQLTAVNADLLAALEEAEKTLTALGFDGELGDMPNPVLDNARRAIWAAKGDA